MSRPPEKISGWNFVERIFRMQRDRETSHRQQAVPALLWRRHKKRPLQYARLHDMTIAPLFGVGYEAAKKNTRCSELEAKGLLERGVIGEELAQHGNSPGQG
jgi:hypothetical protein